MRRALSAIRRTPVPLRLLLGCTLVLSLAWSVAVAPLQGFDEPDHVAYATYLAEHGKPPKATSGSMAHSTLESTALGPLGGLRTTGNAEARPVWQETAEDAFDRYEDDAPAGAAGDGDGPNPLAKNPPLYYAGAAIAYRLTPGGGFFDRLQAMRLVGTLMLLIAVTATWLAAGEAFGRRRVVQLSAAGVVALHPVAGYLSGIVNTDAQLMACFAVLLWLALRTLRLGPSVGRFAVLALPAGAAVLTHGRGLAAVPVLLVAIAATLLRHRPPVRPALLASATAGAVVVAALGIYRVVTSAAGGGGLYGGEVSFGPSASFSLRQLASLVWQFYFGQLGSLEPRIGPPYGFRQVWVETGFSSFGSYEIFYGPFVLDLIQLALVGFVLALAGLAVRRFERLRPNAATILIVGSVVVSVLGLLHLASYRALLGGGNDPLITGRYLLPLVPVMGLGLAALVGAGRRAGPYLAAIVLALLLSLSLGGLGLTLVRFYA